MLLIEGMLWLGVVGYVLLLAVSALGSLAVSGDPIGNAARKPRRPGESRGRRPSDGLTVVWFAPCDRAGRAHQGRRGDVSPSFLRGDP